MLSAENQLKIANALQAYQAGIDTCLKDFYTILQSRIDEKQSQYDALLANLSTGELPVEVVPDIGERMQSLKAEIEALSNATPPEDTQLSKSQIG